VRPDGLRLCRRAWRLSHAADSGASPEVGLHVISSLEDSGGRIRSQYDPDCPLHETSDAAEASAVTSRPRKPSRNSARRCELCHEEIHGIYKATESSGQVENWRTATCPRQERASHRRRTCWNPPGYFAASVSWRRSRGRLNDGVSAGIQARQIPAVHGIHEPPRRGIIAGCRMKLTRR